ncbi:leucine-rich repeat domain-containing protein [Gimesia panareensis]|uniref:leucine-rich repeat domain-containing protein n=1 Tax=Gimesia panareensis TaxID=2527978 RepID=UPI0011892A61|nr:leucine-rich repeat domain-containing protein [Gimesia panareensis]QDU50573.1 Leucine Rich repeats (2 copies) [Gimesia panareensis]
MKWSRQTVSTRFIWGLSLALTIVLITGCGKKRDANSQAATEYVLELGGKVLSAESDLPIDTTAKIPEGGFAVREIDLTDAKIKNNDLHKLSDLPYLESLNLHGTMLTDKGLQKIEDLPRLQSLELSYTRVTDAEVSQLTRFPKLRKIFLYGTVIKPQTIEDLKSNLKGVTIYK